MPRIRLNLPIRTCPVCGVTFQVISDNKNKRFCSLECYRRPPSSTQPTKEETAGGYRLIPLTQGQVAKVDTADYESLMAFNWYARWNSNTRSYYAERQTRRLPGGKQRAIQMGRQILEIADPKLTVDHRNHDTLDFTRSNLRTATYIQNAQNAVFVTFPRSGYRGVTLRTGPKPWKARIMGNGRCYELGSFATAKEASDAYEAKAAELHGEFYYRRGLTVI